jgi:hypothetical protein
VNALGFSNANHKKSRTLAGLNAEIVNALRFCNAAHPKSMTFDFVSEAGGNGEREFKFQLKTT